MNGSEVWKDVAGYEGYYQVSNKGNVYSVERKDLRGRKIGGRTLKPRYDKDGYLKVVLYKNGITKNKIVHRLVAEAFIPNPESLPQINHKDEVKDNNDVENLEWCNARYNNNYGERSKKASQAKSKKVRAVNVETGEILTFSSGVETGDRGFYVETVYLACKGVYKNNTGKLIGGDGRLCKGYRWHYE